MATFALIHGAGDVGWYWHLVAAELLDRGHDVVAPDLPSEDDSAGLVEYADTVVAAIGDRSDVVVVAQSLGGFVAPIVCQRIPVDLLVLLAGMIPVPGESPDDWWANTGYLQEQRNLDEHEDRPTDDIGMFYHDVPPDLATEALRARSQRVRHADEATFSAVAVAECADEVPAVPRRSRVSRRVHAPGRARTAGHHRR